MTDFTSVDDTRFGIKSAQRKAQLPWTLVAKGATKTLRQICGVRPSGLRMLESTLKDVPMREGEEFPSLPCVAFSCSGICSVSQSFLDFAGESLEKVLGSDLRRAPLHWVLPMETNKWLNLEAWVPLEKLHKSAFAGASRLRQQNRVQANEEEEEATTSITTSVSSSQSMFLEERTPVTVSLLLSPGREGKVFWNLVHGFRTEIKKELLVIHVLMPIAVDVPSSFWTSQTGATTPTNGPIPELTPYVDGILQRLRSKLGKMQAQEAKQVKGVEDHFHTEEVPLPPSPARRRASDLGPMGQTQPNLPTELLRVAMTRRISEVSLCSSLPELFELWDAGAASAMRCRALEATELRCRELARALSDVWSGIHFVPRFGSAMALPYELYYFWEEVLANESQVLMSHWKYGKKGDRSHRRELFNIEPYMILDPDETDCPIAYMSQGLEDLFGYWRAWALGRNFRFLMLPDALPNRVFNGQEFSRIEDFCCNQGQKEQGSADAASHMMSLLRLYSVKSKQPIWCCLYLRHVWLQDPTVFESQFDFSAKHFILAVCLPLYTQMPALRDLLNNDMLETNMQLTARLRIMLMERTQNVEFCEKEAHAILNSLIPAWLLECGRGVPTCMVGQHFVPRLGLAPLKDFQGLWPHLVRLLFRLKNPPSEEMFQPTLHDQEQGLACWVVDVRSKDLPLVFISQALQRLSGFDADFALARNVQLFQPKKQRIDQAINNEESARLQEFSEQNRTHGDVMASLLLLERRNGQRFFVVQQTFYLKEPRSDRSYLLSVLHPIETPMPAVLKSHQITELSEDEMGMALDEWGMFLIQAREDPVGKPLMLSNVQKACEVYALSFAAFLRTCEDYVGDLFVPKIGLVEVHAFKGVLEPLVHQKLRADLRRVLADDRAEERLKEIIMTVVDPSGEDDPLVWISPGFEEYTGYQHEWVLGRNCRFLQPKDFDRNQRFNGDQLHKLRKFCLEGRKSSPPTVPTTLALLLNERRNGSPFWNLSSFIHVEVNEKRYIVSVMLPFLEERVRFAELLSDDPEALEQQKRLKGLLARHEGGAKFISLEAVQRQLLSVFFADFPMLLQAPSVRSPNGLEIPIFGLEVSANNTQVSGALKAGVRHVHILLPSGPTTRASDGSTFVRKILPLKLAEVLNNLQQQHLHYLREAMVITVRTPPHLVFVLAEVRKTLATAGYSVACWFLDVRGCTPADVGDHWQAISQAKAPSEAVGIFGGNQRLLQAIHRRGAFVSICAVKVHPGKRPDEPEMRLMSKLACNGTLPMAYGIFGPQNSWLQSSQAQSAAGRLNIAPSTLALKWAEYKGFLALVPDLQDLFASEVPVEHRSFMRLYRAAPSVEICSSVLWGTTGVIPEVLTTPRARVASPKLCRSKDFQQLIPGLCPGATPKAPKKEAQAVKQQILPDLVKRAHQGRPGLVWHGEVASKRLQVEASPRAAGGNHDSEEMVEADYNLPWPSEMEDLDDLLGSSAPEALKPIRRPRPQPPLRRKRPREVLIVSVGEDKVVPEETDEAACGYKSLFVSLGMK